MVKSVDSSLLQTACSMACEMLEDTDTPKSKVFRYASNEFGVSMAAVERAVKARMGEEWLRERGMQMAMKYGHLHYGKKKYERSSSQIIVESSLRDLKRMMNDDGRGR